MARYLASQIELGKLDYQLVIEKYPQFKQEIDEYLSKDKEV
jgi:hypothetical protein